MRIRREGFFQGYKGQRLFHQSWEHETPEAHLVITHGQGEHSGSYGHALDALKDLPISFHAWDLRGHGRSEGRRGFVNEFQEYCLDYEQYLRLLRPRAEFQNKHVFYLGHSMGGVIQLKTMIDFPTLHPDAQILSAPALGLALEVPLWKRVGAEYLKKWAPSLTLSNEISNLQVSRDPEMHRIYDKDVLRHHQIAASVFLGFFEMSVYIEERAGRLSLPTFLQMSTDDPVASTSKALQIFEMLPGPDNKVIQYENYKHEIYNDLGREKPLADLKSYIENFLVQKQRKA